jgi:SlyX protein
MNERLQRLEEKIAYLERHVTEQDKVMLELGDALAKLRLELRTLRERSGGLGAGEGDKAPADERPPHY